MIIKHLHPQEAQKIAAGEVIERPVNIIKELIENALDAGATKITIAVKDGGKKSIIITDNGIGMDEDDARICFLRHTTSKLTTFNELFSLETFGFRGEALASICSVAHVTIITRASNNNHGIKLNIENGVITKEEIVGVAVGTTITINDLFYNIPARQKFLKTTTTEFNQITQLFKAFCLSNLFVHFTLSHNDLIIYTCPNVATLQERTSQIFDGMIAQHLFLLKENSQNFSISGIVTSPHYSKYDRSGIFIFVNKRWIKNFGISQAIIKAYKNILPTGKYPLAVISITISSDQVDINTHPKKEDVVFLHPRTVENCIHTAITNALEQSFSRTLSQTIISSPLSLEIPSSINQSHHVFKPFFSNQSAPATYTQPFKSPNIIPSDQSVQNIEIISQPVLKEITQESYIPEFLECHTILGQLHTTYILLEHPEGLLLIDQHAAHERILYEHIENTFDNPETIQLLFPETVSLQEEVIESLAEYFSLLHNYGIVIEQFSNKECIIRSKPIYAQSVNIQELLYSINGWIHDFGKAEKETIKIFITEKIRAQLACKAAIKAGNSLSLEEMQALIKKLNQTRNRFSCPHGRPTSWLLSTLDIERKFKR